MFGICNRPVGDGGLARAVALASKAVRLVGPHRLHGNLGLVEELREMSICYTNDGQIYSLQ